MKKLTLCNRRFFREVPPEGIMEELDSMATILEGCGCNITRSSTGTVIMELEDRIQYYIPRVGWIEEVVFLKEDMR